MQVDLNKILIESMLKKAVKDIHISPGRTIRNLVDLAVNFSRGRFQKRFLCSIQEMLQNPNSKYYQLLTDIVSNVDIDLLIKFGMNLGYNGCTKGAKLIREIEAEKGFNIPWALILNVNPEKLEAEPETYPEILRQGVSLGIHVYCLGIRTGNPEKLIPVFEGRPDCAFVIFLNGHQITEKFLESVKENQNVMISVYNDKSAADTCAKLREHRLLYAVQQRYTEKDREEILSGKWIDSVLPLHPQCAFLVPDTVCGEEIRREVDQYVTTVRKEQKYPVLFMETVADMWKIDSIISEDACVVGFEKNGNVCTYKEIREEKAYNIFENSMEDILRVAAKK